MSPPKPRTVASTTAITPGALISLRAAGSTGGELSAAERRELLADVRGNPGTTARLTVVANTYIQRATPNRNFVRFREGSLRAVSRSFRGMPFLRDHDTHDFGARGGTIVDSELVDLVGEEKAGLSVERAFRQTLELVKPWAIEAALDGTLDRFSIGWRDGGGGVNCTVCGEPYVRTWWWLAPSCDHEAGETYEHKGEQIVCQAEFQNAEGIEVSGVSVPAVLGTGIEEVRAALAAAPARDPEARRALLAFLASGVPDGPLIDSHREAAAAALLPQETPMLKAIAQALGLAVDADERAILAEIQRRDSQLAAESAQRAQVELQFAQLSTQVNEQRCTALVERAVREGKVVPNSDVALKLGAFARQSFELAEAWVNSLPRITPVGAGLASREPAAAGEPAPDLNEAERSVCAQLRLPPAQFAATRNARAGAAQGG